MIHCVTIGWFPHKFNLTCYNLYRNLGLYFRWTLSVIPKSAATVYVTLLFKKWSVNEYAYPGNGLRRFYRLPRHQ
ncbi:hypothetical protein A8990_15313 [Paenibacillus taihuensis]|uniref:Uncharacterized protein n=1 Tax=Paenibacillus taihuensis TaxID=1156355 RepID=A0A3D9Q4C6_9BACL|nr:hypothetical protein A8990_15313 [Paenibacillus taihuensis]